MSDLVSDNEGKIFVGSRGSLRVEGEAGQLISLGGASSQRGICKTSFSTRTDASIRGIKQSLVEVEERYHRAMVSLAQLHNERSSLMYQVETLREELSDMEEKLWEARHHHDDISKELERERQSHSFLQFRLEEMKETLRQTKEMLTKDQILPEDSTNGLTGQADDVFTDSGSREQSMLGKSGELRPAVGNRPMQANRKLKSRIFKQLFLRIVLSHEQNKRKKETHLNRNSTKFRCRKESAWVLRKEKVLKKGDQRKGHINHFIKIGMATKVSGVSSSASTMHQQKSQEKKPIFHKPSDNEVLERRHDSQHTMKNKVDTTWSKTIREEEEHLTERDKENVKINSRENKYIVMTTTINKEPVKHPSQEINHSDEREEIKTERPGDVNDPTSSCLISSPQTFHLFAVDGNKISVKLHFVSNQQSDKQTQMDDFRDQLRSEVTTSAPHELPGHHYDNDPEITMTSCGHKFVFDESHFAEPAESLPAHSAVVSGHVTMETNRQTAVTFDFRTKKPVFRDEDLRSNIRQMVELKGDGERAVRVTTKHFHHGQIRQHQRIKATLASGATHKVQTPKVLEEDSVVTCEEEMVRDQLMTNRKREMDCLIL